MNATRLASFNHRLIPEAEAAISVWDFGFTMGVTLTEQLRTFGGRPRYLNPHLERLKGGMEILGLDPGEVAGLPDTIEELLARNQAVEPEAQEWRIGICVTPGSSAAPNSGTTQLVYTQPLDIEKLNSMYEQGVVLNVVKTREQDDASIPKSIKHRNRIHYWLANKEAASISAESFPLLLTRDGFLAESSIASIGVLNQKTLTFPRQSTVQKSVTCEILRPLTAQLGLEWIEADISVEEAQRSDEVFWVNASSVIAPVVNIDSVPIGDGSPGKTFQALSDTWWSQHQT